MKNVGTKQNLLSDFHSNQGEAGTRFSSMINMQALKVFRES